jgi:transcriptional antiterminator Rof (Rho-off)
MNHRRGDKMALTNEDLLAMSNLLDDKLKPIKDDIDTLEKKVTSIELTLENETNHGIKIIAEGHLDLSRKLDEALKVENEKEMLLLRVNHLENELRKVKERISQIA